MTSDRLPRLRARFVQGAPAAFRCGEGWDPLLSRLDDELTALFPSYGLLQVKEKYGTLRFYTDIADALPACCVAWDAAHPHPPAGASQRELDRWADALADAWLEHESDAEHVTCAAVLEAARDRAWMLITAAEVESAAVCESCGAPGALLAAAGWFQTRCDEHRR